MARFIEVPWVARGWVVTANAHVPSPEGSTVWDAQDAQEEHPEPQEPEPDPMPPAAPRKGRRR